MLKKVLYFYVANDLFIRHRFDNITFRLVWMHHYALVTKEKEKEKEKEQKITLKLTKIISHHQFLQFLHTNHFPKLQEPLSWKTS